MFWINILVGLGILFISTDKIIGLDSGKGLDNILFHNFFQILLLVK